MSTCAPSIEAKGLTRVYRRGSEEIYAVRDADLAVERGEFVSFVGPSGSGKTTLVNLLGCLDNPTSGDLWLSGEKIFGDSGRPPSEGELTQVRRRTFGYVFQNFYLIPTLTVRENVLLPLAFYRKPDGEARCDELLELLGIANRREHLPEEISGGEMQRVAIARALVNEPEVLIADEPTGNLDSRRSAEIGRVIRDMNRNRGVTVVLVTHDPEIARLGDRIVELSDGRIVAQPPD